jgi:hypothetical protein
MGRPIAGHQERRPDLFALRAEISTAIRDGTVREFWKNSQAAQFAEQPLTHSIQHLILETHTPEMDLIRLATPRAVAFAMASRILRFCFGEVIP